MLERFELVVKGVASPVREAFRERSSQQASDEMSGAETRDNNGWSLGDRAPLEESLGESGARDRAHGQKEKRSSGDERLRLFGDAPGRHDVGHGVAVDLSQLPREFPHARGHAELGRKGARGQLHRLILAF